MLKVTPAIETKADPVPNPVHQLRVYDGGLLCVSDNCKSWCATAITFESRGQLLCRTSAIPTFPPLLLGRRHLPRYQLSELCFLLILSRRSFLLAAWLTLYSSDHDNIGIGIWTDLFKCHIVNRWQFLVKTCQIFSHVLCSGLNRLP